MKNTNDAEQINTDDGANAHRRSFLKNLSKAIGYTAAATVLGGTGMSVAMAYTPNPNSTKRPGLLFSQDQMKTLHDISATVLPATDTKSGAEVDCHGFVDNQLTQCHGKDEQQVAINAVELVQKNAQKQYKKAFVALNQQQQTTLLRDIESLTSASEDEKGQFKFLKSLIVFGFFTSQEGATKALRFQPFPGGFKGSVKITKDTTTWGSLNYY